MSFFKRWYDVTITIGFIGTGISVLLTNWTVATKVFLSSLYLICISVIYATAITYEEKARKEKEEE